MDDVNLLKLFIYAKFLYQLLQKTSAMTYQTSSSNTAATHKTSGRATGKSIKSQLNALQLSIGCAPFWKALIAMIAIDRATPAHDVQPNSMLGTLLAFSIQC